MTIACGPGCRYRAMYEGSQASLTDMAAQHQHALARLAALRSGLADTLKRAFPSDYAAAEALLAGRLGDVPDDVLLAYLLSFASGAAASPSVAPQGLAELRQALEGRGARLPSGLDLSAWAVAVRALPDSAPAQPTVDAAPAIVAGAVPVSAPPAPAPAPALNEGAGEPIDSLTALFGEDPEWGADPFADDGPPRADDLAPFDVPPPPDPELGDLLMAPVDDVPPPDFDPLPAPPIEPPPPEVAPAPAASTAPTPAAEPAGELGLTQPLRPQALFPQGTAGKTPKRRTKTARVSAQAPDESLDVPVTTPATTGPVDPSVSDTVLRMALGPKPVFTSDLVPLLGTLDAAEAWERQIRGQATSLRFVAARSRHRQRGSLVLPHHKTRDADARPDALSWWTQCCAQYRGARLYELGVLLHAVGDTIVSHQLGPEAAVFRLNTQRGLVGLVVVLESQLGASQPTRAAVCDALDSLLAERLAMIAVLPVDDRALDPAIAALNEEKAARGWVPATTVVAATSWAYAANPTNSVRAVFADPPA